MTLLELLASYYAHDEVIGNFARITCRNGSQQVWLKCYAYWVDMTPYHPDVTIELTGLEERILTVWLHYECSVYTDNQLSELSVMAQDHGCIFELAGSKDFPSYNKNVDALSEIGIALIQRDPIALDMARDLLKL